MTICSTLVIVLLLERGKIIELSYYTVLNCIELGTTNSKYTIRPKLMTFLFLMQMVKFRLSIMCEQLVDVWECPEY